MPVSSQVLVGMADIKVVKGPGVLTCLGLGSCIGLIAFDPGAEVCGVVHIMLPEQFKDKPVDKPGKFADTGIPALLQAIEAQGARKNRLIMAYAGGAQVFKYGNESTGLDVGNRNAMAVKSHLLTMGAKVVASDIGGTSGRTVIVHTDTGEVRVRTVQGGERTLCNLRA